MFIRVFVCLLGWGGGTPWPLVEGVFGGRGTLWPQVLSRGEVPPSVVTGPISGPVQGKVPPSCLRGIGGG